MALKEEKKVQVVTDERRHKVVSVIGTGGNDILFFFMRTAINACKNVLFIDNSEDGAVFELNKKEDTEGCICIDNSSIVRNMAYNEKIFEIFDYVVISHGMQIDRQILSKSDEVFVFTDYDRFHMARIATLLKKAEITKAKVVYIGKMNEMVTEAYICSYFGVTSEKDFIIEFSEADQAAYIAITHGKKAQFTKYDKSFREAVAALSADILDMTDKSAKRFTK